MLQVLLIDHRRGVRNSLRAILAASSDQNQIEEAGTMASARRLLSGATYDLVLLSIDFPEGGAFELFSQARLAARTVLVTRLQRGVLSAFALGAADYLVAPLGAHRVAEAMKQLQPLTGGARAVRPVGRGGQSATLKAGLLSRHLRLDRIRLILALENYTEVVLVTNARFLVRRTMGQWLDLLPKGDFGRVHRGAIVNFVHVKHAEVRPGAPGRLHFHGSGVAPFVVSRRFWPGVRERLAREKIERLFDD